MKLTEEQEKIVNETAVELGTRVGIELRKLKEAGEDLTLLPGETILGMYFRLTAEKI